MCVSRLHRLEFPGWQPLVFFEKVKNMGTKMKGNRQNVVLPRPCRLPRRSLALEVLAKDAGLFVSFSSNAFNLLIGFIVSFVLSRWYLSLLTLIDLQLGLCFGSSNGTDIMRDWSVSSTVVAVFQPFSGAGFLFRAALDAIRLIFGC